MSLGEIESESILGINYSGMHDSAIAVVSPSGKPTYAISLERVTRKKQDGRFPKELLKDLPWEKISKVAISVSEKYEMSSATLKSKTHPLPLKFEQHVDHSHAPEFFDFFDTIPREKVFLQHHFCHASSSFWASGYSRAICLVYDGGMSNEKIFGAVYLADIKKGIKEIDSFDANRYANITHLYSAITAILGFTPLRHEGKITGLAALGKSQERCQRIFEEWLVDPNLLNPLMNWVSMYSAEKPPSIIVNRSALSALSEKLNEFSKEDIAATLQSMTESHVIDLIKNIQHIEPDYKNICLSGGLFANVKVNQRVSELTFKNVFIAPPMTDDGTALGAALHIASENEKFRRGNPLTDVYLGSKFNLDESLEFLKGLGVKLQNTDDDASLIATKLANGSVVAIFNGASEFGPRALGNRSIFAPAMQVDVNQTLNARLERTDFMPFAPIVREEDAGDYFDIPRGIEYACQFMTITTNCSELAKQECPAAVHVDGTARPQIVTQETNPFIHNVLSNYKDLVGRSVLVNTSFNIHEEPIVNSLEDALRGFFESGLDYLYIGGIGLIALQDNLSLQISYLKTKMKRLKDEQIEEKDKITKVNIEQIVEDNFKKQTEIIQISNSLISCEEKLKNLNIEIDNLKRSKSWRITAPLRYFYRLIKLSKN
jgi:carbamoyltransferase